MSAMLALTDRCRRHDVLMDPSTDGDGRTIWTCRPCIRFAAGLCVDCPHARVGLSPRCPRCRMRKRRSHEDGRYPRRRVSLCAQKRDVYRDLHPLLRAMKLRDIADRYLSHPRNAIDRSYDRAVSEQRRRKAGILPRQKAA